MIHPFQVVHLSQVLPSGHLSRAAQISQMVLAAHHDQPLHVDQEGLEDLENQVHLLFQHHHVDLVYLIGQMVL